MIYANANKCQYVALLSEMLPNKGLDPLKYYCYERRTDLLHVVYTASGIVHKQLCSKFSTCIMINIFLLRDRQR